MTVRLLSFALLEQGAQVDPAIARRRGFDAVLRADGGMAEPSTPAGTTFRLEGSLPLPSPNGCSLTFSSAGASLATPGVVVLDVLATAPRAVGAGIVLAGLDLVGSDLSSPEQHRTAVAERTRAAVVVAVEAACNLVVLIARVAGSPDDHLLRAHGDGLIDGFAGAPAVPIDRAYPAPAI